ncbi:MAG: hypothetical protein JSS07_12370 [Proteobacteria bacterium]|nr:hypothetical protein [Pseudomonadota bacterium]
MRILKNVLPHVQEIEQDISKLCDSRHLYWVANEKISAKFKSYIHLLTVKDIELNKVIDGIPLCISLMRYYLFLATSHSEKLNHLISDMLTQTSLAWNSQNIGNNCTTGETLLHLVALAATQGKREIINLLDYIIKNNDLKWHIQISGNYLKGKSPLHLLLKAALEGKKEVAKILPMILEKAHIAKQPATYIPSVLKPLHLPLMVANKGKIAAYDVLQNEFVSKEHNSNFKHINQPLKNTDVLHLLMAACNEHLFDAAFWFQLQIELKKEFTQEALSHKNTQSTLILINAILGNKDKPLMVDYTKLSKSSWKKKITFGPFKGYTLLHLLLAALHERRSETMQAFNYAKSFLKPEILGEKITADGPDKGKTLLHLLSFALFNGIDEVKPILTAAVQHWNDQVSGDGPEKEYTPLHFLVLAAFSNSKAKHALEVLTLNMQIKTLDFDLMIKGKSIKEYLSSENVNYLELLINIRMALRLAKESTQADLDLHLIKTQNIAEMVAKNGQYRAYMLMAKLYQELNNFDDCQKYAHKLPNESAERVFAGILLASLQLAYVKAHLPPVSHIKDESEQDKEIVKQNNHFRRERLWNAYQELLLDTKNKYLSGLIEKTSITIGCEYLNVTRFVNNKPLMFGALLGAATIALADKNAGDKKEMLEKSRMELKNNKRIYKLTSTLGKGEEQ